MMEKWKLITLIICIVAITICATTVAVLYVTNSGDTSEKDPFVEIRDKNNEYVTTLNGLLNETQNAILDFGNTNNITYLSYAMQVFDATASIQVEYDYWFTYNVSKQIDDKELDSKIFHDVHIMGLRVNSMMINLWLAQSKVM